MGGLFLRLRESLARLFYGRNGFDALNGCLLALYLLLAPVAALLSWVPVAGRLLIVLRYAALAALLFRAFSKNIPGRQAENRFFAGCLASLRGFFAERRRQKEDTAHCYFRCRACKTLCRVPRGVGRIELSCPKCGKKRRVTT